MPEPSGNGSWNVYDHLQGLSDKIEVILINQGVQREKIDSVITRQGNVIDRLVELEHLLTMVKGGKAFALGITALVGGLYWMGHSIMEVLHWMIVPPKP